MSSTTDPDAPLPIEVVDADFLVDIPDHTPSVVQRLPLSRYLADSGVSQSTLSELGRTCPAIARYRQLHPSEDSEALFLGSAIHCALLEPDRFAAEYATGPDCKLNTKAGKETWRAFEDENPGRILLRAHQGEIVEGILERAASSPRLAVLRGTPGLNEISIFWDESGVRCKARLDKLAKEPRRMAVIDVKSARSAAPEAWRRDLANYRYHIQAAWYRMAVRAVRGSAPVDFYHVIFEKTPPYALAIRQMSEEALRRGESEVRALLHSWRVYSDTDHWPDYSERITLSELPIWYDPISDFIIE